MNNSRRKFLKQSAFTVAALSVAKAKTFASPAAAVHLVGVQLYSVRTDMDKDPSGTLKQVAEMGYQYVEHANYVKGKFYGYAPQEFKKILDDLGLKMRSGHTVMTAAHWDAASNDFTDVWKKTVEDAAAVGQLYVISPWLDEALRTDVDKLKQFMDVFNKCGELCSKYSMKFGYHNHDFEIATKVGDENLYDFIIKNTDPKFVIQQIDIGNMYGNGGRAIEIMKKYPGRFQSMHVKDEIKAAKGEMAGEPYESTVLGKGVLNVKEILDYGKNHGGTKHFIIEQESYQDQTPLDAVKEDLVVMKKWGY